MNDEPQHRKNILGEHLDNVDLVISWQGRRVDVDVYAILTPASPYREVTGRHVFGLGAPAPERVGEPIVRAAWSSKHLEEFFEEWDVPDAVIGVVTGAASAGLSAVAEADHSDPSDPHAETPC